MQSKKQQQVAQIVKRNFGMVLFNEGMNIYQDALVTVTNVIMTPDLSTAKIYLSVYNADNKMEVIQLLNNQLRLLKSNLVCKIAKKLKSKLSSKENQKLRNNIDNFFSLYF